MLEVIKKHAKDFTLNNSERKVLQGIFYKEDGSVVMTNSHILLYAKNVHNLKEPVVKHYKTGKVIKEKYPNIDSFLKTYPSSGFTLNMKNVAPSLGALKVSNHLNEVGVLKDDLTFKVVDVIGQNFTLTIDGISNGEFNPIHLKVMNLYKCLSIFKDLKINSVQVRIRGSLSSVSFTDEAERILVIISPVWRH